MNTAQPEAVKKSDMPTEERTPRLFPHRPAKGTVICRTGKFGMGRAMKGKLIDISPAGAGILMENEVEFGEKIELELQGVGSSRRIIVMAEIRYVSNLEGSRLRVGVCFEKRLTQKDLADLVR